MKLFQPSPIEFGQIKKIWSDSYHGQKSYFLNNQTIIYACDSVIKLYDTETKESKRFHPFGEGEKANENGICLLTANSAIGKFAFSEIHLSPKVYVYSYEQNAIKEQTKLLDGAVLEYLAIEFSNSEAILTLSGIPDQQIIVWSWKTGKRLVNINLKASLGRPEDLSFCPTNWRRLTVAYKSELNVWNLDQFDSDRIKSFNQRFVFPVTDDSVDEEQVAPEFKEEFESSKLAITGLNEAYKEDIEDILDKRKRHQFSCLCWLSNDEVLVSTQANYIFRYDLSSSTVKCVFKPHQNSLDDERFIIESDHLITKLYLHRQGLFALCIDNNLRVLEGNELVPLKDKHSSSETLVKKIINTSADKIANLSFNTKYTSLAISTNRGIELLDCARLFENEIDKEILNLELDFNNHAMSQEDSRLGLAVNFDYGRVVGADTIVGLNNQQFYLVLKEFGTIQVWSLEDSRIVNRLNLNQKSSYLAAHPYMPLVVVGTDEGRLVFIDFSNQLYPRVLEVCNLHRNVVRLLKFNSSGTILFSVGDDKKIFLIDVSLSNRVEPLLSKLDQRLQTVYKKPLGFEPGFYVLGYLEFEGEAVCIDTFDYDESQGEKKIITRVAVGVHDPNNWEITKKNLAESALNMSMSNNPIAPSGDQPASVTHTLVVQNAQTNSTISRMQYSHLSSEPDFIKWDEDASSNRVKLASRVLQFEISYKLISDKAVYNTSKLDLKDELINRSAFHTQYLFSDLVLTARNYLVIFSERFLIKMLIPDMEPAKKILNKLNYLEFSEVIGSHDFGYGRLSKTTNNQIILSGGYDGSIQIRKAIDLTPFNEFRANSFTNGGIEIVKLSEFDKKSIITIGYDNTVFKLEWNCQNDHTTKIAKSDCLKGDFNPEALKNLKNEENPNPGYETWFEIKEAEFFKQQDSQYLPKKKEILNGLTEIKKRINELMSVNQSRDELSKLKEHEFYLDLEELERLHKEADSEILQIRDKTDFENTAKLFVREKIKGECWEDMKVKGRGISAFNSNLLVENYPLKEKSKEEQQLLDRIKIIRTIEMKIQKNRSELTHDIMRRENINELFEADEDDSNEGGQQQQQQVSNYTNPNLAQLSYKGSISSLFNGDSPLLYNQFELYAREQKWIQISLIQECIGKIKENFNKEFENVMQRKVQEIARIKEKNLRLKQIYSDLNEEKQLDEPILGDSENPESLFQVKDEEIKVEKYLSPEQKRLLEEQLAEEARRRELERLDNWRERGLIDMMGGVLQIRREDELKKDVPIPSFVKEKPQEEWTLEEQAQYQQYEKKVQELNEERVKLRKQLNVEINKINEQILECYQNFDNALFSLHQRKVKTQQAIFQEELKIVRLVNSLIVDLELETYNTQINERLERSKKEKNELNDEIQQVKKSIEAFKVEYEILSAQDKAQEKAFIREFADVSSAMRDQLLKLFRKRPKQRIVVNKTILSPHPMQIAELGSENNPFADRPSTAQQQLLSEAELNAALADLDHIDNGPPGVDIGLWSRFVEFRRAKIALENSMRMKAINLNEMMLYLQKRAEDDEAKRREIEELARNALNIQTLRLKASHNLQVQLLLKQGQVEIDPGPYVHNMENCLLIDRKEVESLNKIIQDHGKQKITIMIDSKNYRKGIRQFEWEHKKMKMTIEDYIQKQRDITYLKLTREVQEFLNSENYDGKKQQEISTLEQTIAYKKEQYSRIYANQNKKMKGVRDHSVKVANNNLSLDDELKDKNVVLYERKHVENEMTGKTSETLRNERFQQIIQRRKLVDLAKAQAQEVAFLRSEVERLRMKTFPALVQIEF